MMRTGMRWLSAVAFGLVVGGTAMAQADPTEAKEPTAQEKLEKRIADLSGGPAQFMNQLWSVCLTWVLAAVATFVILKIVNAVVGLRPNEQDETQGLDLSLHGEQAYNN